LTLLLQQPAPKAEPVEVVTPTVVPETTDPTVAPAPPVETREVLTLSRAVTQGTAMQPDDFTWVEWPTEFLMSRFILRDGQPDAAYSLGGSIASFDMQPDEPVLASAFATIPEARQISEDSILRRVRPGMRAVPLRIQMDEPMFGYFNSGDFVDLVHVYFPNDGINPVGRTIASNVRLLEIAPYEDDEAVEDERRVSRNVVIELASGDATEVMAAAQIGTLSMLLRAPAEEDEPVLETVSLSQSISPGFRGVVLPDVNLTSAGLIQPNDRVDILFTPVVDDMRAAPSTVIIENSRVVEVRRPDGQPAPTREAEAPASLPRASITVELDFAGTEVVTAAIQAGHLSVSLRSARDVERDYRVSPLPQTPVTVRVRRAGSF